MNKTITVPLRCASCGRTSVDAFGACTHCGGVFRQPDVVTLLARFAADECTDHAALIAAVRACRVRRYQHGVWMPRKDWEQVAALVGEGEDKDDRNL